MLDLQGLLSDLTASVRRGLARQWKRPTKIEIAMATDVGPLHAYGIAPESGRTILGKTPSARPWRFG
jgi:hypothetical protein